MQVCYYFRVFFLLFYIIFVTIFINKMPSEMKGVFTDAKALKPKAA